MNQPPSYEEAIRNHSPALCVPSCPPPPDPFALVYPQPPRGCNQSTHCGHCKHKPNPYRPCNNSRDDSRYYRKYEECIIL